MTMLAEAPRTKAREFSEITEFVCEGSLGKVQVRCNPDGVEEIRFLSANLASRGRKPPENDWTAALRRALCDYLNGEAVAFDEFPIDLSGQTAFRRRVLEECRRIPSGETVTYAQLAERAGNPSAVRAVGSAMSHNPIPIIIPCHRVVRSDGGLGGFSAPDGVNMKERLLAMERR